MRRKLTRARIAPVGNELSYNARIPGVRRSATALLLATTALTGSLAIVPAQAQNLPTGGSVAAGSVTIASPAATRLNITQTSQSAVVNWQSFSIGHGSAVNIQQPNSASALLNRVSGNTPSTIAGSLTANGQVYLVNPNGIAITRSGTVNTGGGFVASTLGISDSDFLAGRRTFTGNGASAKVSNAGTITVGRGGYAALIGGTVSNSGSISVPLGKVGLGSGERATLDFSGDGFLQVAMPTAAGGKRALIRNAGRIKADGGSVIISAATARSAARNAVNISGLVQARTIGGRSGAIVIGGGGGGRVKISGRLAASAHRTTGGAVTITGRAIRLARATVDVSGKTGGGTVNIGGGRQGGGPLQHADRVTIDAASVIKADATTSGNGGNVVVWSDHRTSFGGSISAKGGALSGNGGEAEVSGKAKLDYTGFTNLSAANGSFGTLLLDPFNVTISNGANNTGGSFTANTNDSIINAATLQTALGAANVTVTTGSGGAQAGNITVATPLTWGAATTLTLNAANAIAINAPISITGAGGLRLTATAQAGITTTGLTFDKGVSVDYGATNNGGTFRLNGISYTLVYSMAQLDAIDGINAVDGTALTTYGAGQAGNYALATDLTATGTTYTRALMGTNTTETDATRFLGRVDGLGHTITGLTINAPGTDDVGLIGYHQGGSVSNIGLAGGSVTGHDNVGALLGFKDDGTVQTSFASTAVTGNLRVGGLIGAFWKIAMLQATYASGAVRGNLRTGGLAGEVNFGAVVQTSFATGAVSGGTETGGLVGTFSQSSVPGAIRTSYATGAVTGGLRTGGLVGWINPASGATVTDSYWDTQTSGAAISDGGTGLTTAQLQGGTTVALGPQFSGGAAGGTAGLYPYLTNFFVNGVRAVSGIAYKDAGVTPAASGASGAVPVGLTLDGVTQSPVNTGANGYYYFVLPAGAIAGAGTNVLATTAANGATGALNAAALVKATGIVTGLDIFGGALRFSTAATSYAASGYPTALAYPTTPGFVAGLPSFITATGPSFTLDQAITPGANFTVTTSGTNAPLTVAAPITLTGAKTLTLTASGALAINAAVSVTGAGSVVLAAAAQSGVSTTGLTFGQGGSVDFGGSNNGGSFSLNGSSYTLVYSMSNLDSIDSINAIDGTVLARFGGTGLGGNYALATDLDATGTTYTRALIAASPDQFTGRLDGLGHTVTGLTIAAGTGNVGLVGTLAGGTVSNLGLRGGSVTGAGNVGTLVGSNAGTVQTSYATAAVSAGNTSNAGGLIGSSSGTTQASFATGAVTAGNDSAVGGLVGLNANGTIANSYAAGAVTAGSNAKAAGLAGENSGTVTSSYATGTVTAASGSTGGLVAVNTGTVSNSYWDTQTSGAPASAGGAGLTTAQLQGALPAGFSAAVWSTGPGLYPYLVWRFAAGTAQSVSGAAYRSNGSALAGAAIAGTVNGVALAGVSTGANGYYYFLLPQGAISSVFTDVAGNAVKANSYFQGATGTVQNLDLRADTLIVTTNSTALTSVASGLAADVGATPSGDLVFTTPGGVLTPKAGIGVSITAAAGFSIDQALTASSDVLIDAAGSLSIAPAGRVSNSAGNVTLVAGTTFVNNRGSDALAASGRWLVYSADPRNDTRGSLVYDFKQYGATYGVTAVAQPTGNGVLYSLAPIVTRGLTGTIVKPYDGDTSATVAPANFITLGAIDGDTVTFNTVGSATYDDANAATGKLVTTTGVSLASTSNGAAAVHGYTLGATTASGNVGTILARPVVLSGTQTYSGTTAAPAAGLSVSNLVAGDNAGLSGTGVLASKNVGAQALTSTAGALTGLFVSNGNYTVTGGSGTVAVGPANITVTALGGASLAGSSPANPGLAASGLQGGERVDVLAGLSNSFGITSQSDPSQSPYVLSVIGTLDNPNYSIVARIDGSWIVVAPTPGPAPAPAPGPATNYLIETRGIMDCPSSPEFLPACVKAGERTSAAPFSFDRAAPGTTLFYVDKRFGP